MTVDADAYNVERLTEGDLTAADVTELVTFWQDSKGLRVDGKAGTVETIPSIRASARARNAVKPPSGELAVVEHWLIGELVERIDAHFTWFDGFMASAHPLAIVAHFTDTNPGTARNMARRRARQFGQPDDRLASWHVTIDTDGSIVVMIPMNRVAYHAGSPSAAPIPGVGWANSTAVGIELVGFGTQFPDAQVHSACKVWRAIARHYLIPREHAMVSHQSIDPSRRDDPGPLWMGTYAPRVLDFAYAA